MTKALWQRAPTRILCHRRHVVRRPYDRMIADKIHAFIRFRWIRWNRDARANYGDDLCYPISVSPIAFFSRRSQAGRIYAYGNEHSYINLPSYKSSS